MISVVKTLIGNLKYISLPKYVQSRKYPNNPTPIISHTRVSQKACLTTVLYLCHNTRRYMDPRYRLHLSWPSARRSAIFEKVLFMATATIFASVVVVAVYNPQYLRQPSTAALLLIVFFATFFAGADGAWKVWRFDHRQRAFMEIRLDFTEADRLLAQREETPAKYLQRTANDCLELEGELVRTVSVRFRRQLFISVHNEMRIPWHRDRDLFVRCGLIEPGSRVAHLLDLGSP